MSTKAMTPEEEKRSRDEITSLLDSDKYAVSYTLVLHELAGVGEDAPRIWATLDEERAAHALASQELATVRAAPTSDEEFETLLRQGTSAIREALGPHWRPGPDGQREYLSTIECVRRVVAERDAALAELRRLRKP